MRWIVAWCVRRRVVVTILAAAFLVVGLWQASKTPVDVFPEFVPASAVVLAGGEAWCYVAEADDVLARRRVDLGRPLPQGYFQPSGFMPGEHVVVAGAGLLLAREIGGGAEPD